jgi:hypothetical protein
MDAGHEEDAGPIEEDAGDAGTEMDGGEDAASEGGAPYVDGCVPGSSGGCATCDVDTYVQDKSCGMGCFDTPSRCVRGIEYPCLRGDRLSTVDDTCDGVDDNCNGIKDEDYKVESSSCGIGVCAVTGRLQCTNGEVEDTCRPGTPLSLRDDESGGGNGADDDCDGSIDEDVSTCSNTAPRPYEVGTHNIAVPSGCGTVTIQLWGGAGAAGERAGIAEPRFGGKGGSGGYARSMLSVTGAMTITIHVGGGASAACSELLGQQFSTGGTNAGAPSYAGGAGSGSSGEGAGMDGMDGMVTGGGRGALNLLGGDGGNGYYGGGGGGAGWADVVNGLLPEHGGGGGAASVAFMNGMRVLVAGGGGGGGAAATLVYAFGDTGGKGGEGCGGSGTSGNNARVGAGGGGGVCMGMVWSMGSNGEPANASSVPRPFARGTTDCTLPGGNGYAIVTFAR